MRAPGAVDAQKNVTALAAEADQRPAQLDLLRLLQMLWRRKWLLVAAMMLAVLASAAVVSQITPLYRASALVMIETRERNIVDIDSVLPGLGDRATALQSQVQIIRSAQLLERAIDKLRLDLDPEFNATLEPPSFWKGFFSLTAWRAAVTPDWLSAAPPPEDEILKTERIRRAVLDRVAEGLTVRAVPNSFVMAIAFQSSNPRKAALIANTIADQYIVDQLEARFDATQRATVWLNARVGELKARVETAENAVEEYKASRAIVDGQGVELTNQQLAELNTSLIESRAASAEANARFAQVSALLDRGDPIGSVAEVLSSPLIQRLREQEVELLRREAELATRYGDKHPRMINLRAEIRDAERAIEGEVRKIVDGLRNEVQVAKAREQSLQENLDALSETARAQSQSMVKLRQLQREAEATRVLYEALLSRSKETTAQADLQTADARIISHAQPPNEKSSPRTTLALGVAAMLGLGAGVGLAFVLEGVNNTFRTAKEFEAATGVAVLANVPKTGPRQTRRQIFDYVWEKPNSVVAEAVRNMRTSLLLSNVDNPPKVVVVTSAVPGEGKSTLAALLALTTSRMGKSTIIVDCDLRRPAMASIFGGDAERSLVPVVSGRVDFDKAVIVDEREPDLHALIASVSQANSADILSSRRFAELIEGLRAHYDFVVIDTPPTLAVSDARIVAKLADIVLFASRWDATPREAIKAGLRDIQSVGVPIAGAAMTMVDFRRQRSYAAYDAPGYYNRSYGAYYVN